MRSAIRVLLVLAILGLLMPGSARANGTVPVERVNAALLQVMRSSKELGYKGRYATLAPVLTEAFDFRVMARISVGRHWKTLSPDQKTQLIQTFSQLSVAIFASRFDDYGGERFEIMGARKRRRSLVVDNRLIRPSGEAIPLNYVVRESDGRWRIVDVHLDTNISQLAIQRSEYVSLIANEGFERLIAAMEEKVAAFRVGG